MKRFMAMFLITSLAFGQSLCLETAVYAEETTSNTQMSELAAKVLKDVKTRIGDTSEYDKFSTDYETKDHDGTTYTTFSFTWTNSKNNSNLYVECSEYGIITYYYKTEDSKDQSTETLRLSDKIADTDKYI